MHGPGVDEPLVQYDLVGGVWTRTWLIADLSGSIVATANDAGAVAAIYAYGPFGEPAATTGPRRRYTGQLLDPDTQLYYYKARWYSPWLGRFLSPDPAGDVDGPNLYAYVGNDPVNLVDPTGTFGEAAGGFGSRSQSVAQTVQFADASGFLARAGNIASDFGGGFLGVQPLGNNASTASIAGRGAAYAVDGAAILFDVLNTPVSPTPDVGIAAAGRIGARQAAAEAASLTSGRAAVLVGRSGKQARLRELATDPKVSSADRGWIQQEMNSIARGQRTTIRVPPGKNLAHRRGFEAKRG